MVTPDSHLFNFVNGLARLVSNLAHSTIVVQTRHSSKLTWVDTRRIALSNEGISISWVTYHQDFNRRISMIIDRFTLSGENCRIGF